jgi:type I restriction enzyme, S subunit
MGEWKEYKLDDLADIFDYKRIPLSNMERQKRTGNFPYYGASGIIDYVDSYIFEGDYLLISEDGENLRSRQTPIAFEASGKFWVNNHAHIIRGKKDYLNRLIKYYFAQLDLSAFITGAVQPKLSQENLYSITFDLPSDENELQTIVSILSSLDDKIDLLHRQNKTLEQLAETLFRHWFIDTDQSNNTEKLGNVVQTTSGGTPSRSNPSYYINGIYKWVKSKELQGTFIFETEEQITEDALNNSASKILPANSVLIALYGATVGEYAILAEQATCNQAVCAIIPNENYPYPYLFNLIKSNKENLINLAVGSAQQNISQILIKDLRVSSDKDLIQAFHTSVKSVYEKIKSNICQIRTLTQLRDTLLPKLMSGEVRVKWEDQVIVAEEIDTNPIYTIGHSNHSIEKFIRLLNQHKINIIVDIRSAPYSRYNPQYNREQLQQSLKLANIKYLYMGKELGGRPKDLDDYDKGVADYDRILNQKDFKDGIERLLKGRKDFNIAIMCSEKDPLNCHRMLLVGRDLKKFNVPIKHILADGKIEDNSIAEKRLLDITGLKPTLFEFDLDEKQQLEEAYRKRSLDVAFKLPNGEEE